MYGPYEICLATNVFSYRPFENSNNERSVTPGSAAVDFGAQAQDVLHARCIPAGYGVVKKTLLLWKPREYMLFFHRLSETAEVLFGQQSQNPMLVICGINVEFGKFYRENKLQRV